MNIKSAPFYFDYLTQSECPFFDLIWQPKLNELSKDLSWIDHLNEEERLEREAEITSDLEKGVKPSQRLSSEYESSKDFYSDDFPTFYNWPQEWQQAYRDIGNEIHLMKKEHLANADVFEINGSRLYILDESEEVWFSTNHYGNGDITKMDAATDRKVDFDSAITAAYAYKNDYEEWNTKHSSAYKAANILSSSESSVYTDSLKGTQQECDGCAAYSIIVKDDGDVALCANCI